jgi:hypothetical protein
MTALEKLKSSVDALKANLPIGDPLPDGFSASVRLFVNVAYPVNGVEQTESVTFESPYDATDFSAKVAEIGKRVEAAIKALPKE